LTLSRQSGLPRTIDVNVDLAMNPNEMRLNMAHIALGQSKFDASGVFKNVNLEQGSVRFDGNIAMAELGRLLGQPAIAGGSIQLNGSAVTNGAFDYRVDAALTGSGLDFRAGQVRLRNVAFNSRITADPHTVAMNPIRVSIAGGRFNGQATLV